MILENQTLLYAVYQNHVFLYFLLIKIISVSNNTIYANITNIDRNGVILNYTASFPLFEIYYPLNTSKNITEIYGIPTYVYNFDGITLYVDKYNGLVLSRVQGGLNFTINGSTIPLSPSLILPIKIIHGQKHEFNFSVYFLTAVLILGFYTIYRRLGERG